MNIAEKLRLIDSLKGKIDKLMPRKDWDDAFFRKVKIDFTYNSNKLEGNTLTYGQTIKLKILLLDLQGKYIVICFQIR